MPGVRIQHPTAKNCRITIVEPDNPYPVPYQCTAPDLGGCGSVHQFKTHHVNLDAAGAGIISEGVWQRAKKHLLAAGVTTSQVKKPPAIGVGLHPNGKGAWGDIPILHINKEPI